MSLRIPCDSSEVQVADLFQVLRVFVIADRLVAVVQHEKLQCDLWITLGWAKSVAIAGEYDTAAWQRTSPKVEHAVVEVGFAVLGGAVIA
jgi:hypothetical protein